MKKYRKHSTNNTKHSMYKHTYYQYTPTHYKTHTYTHPHITKQVKTTTVQDRRKRNSHNIIKCPLYNVTQYNTKTGNTQNRKQKYKNKKQTQKEY